MPKIFKDSFTKEELEQFYQNHSYLETLEHFKITGGVLDRRLKAYGIQKQSSHDKNVEKISREELYQYYVVENHDKVQTREHFGLTDWALSQFLREFGIRKNKSSIVNLREKTKEQRYGNSTYNNRNKYRETCNEKYGGIGFASDELKQKSDKTMSERYGAENIRKTGFFKQRAAQRKFERYGKSTYNNSEQRRQTCQERYGVDWACMRPEAKLGYSNDSKPNLRFATLLESYGILYEREFPIENRSYDFKIGDKLVEVNPSATHNSTWGILGSKPKEPTYHRDKAELARENGYQCIHVFDWDDLDKVIQLLEPKQTLYARKLKLKEISQLEANRFLKQYHLQNGAKLQTVCLGLFLGQELIEVMTFGKPRFNKNYEWELIRLCTKAEYCVVGGAERLFSAFVQKEHPKSIISYCDNAKFNGNVYGRLGFTLQSSRGISRHWYNLETKVHITDNGLRMQGFDKLLGESYGETFGKGTSNEELMRDHGFVEVFDAGQSVYSWQHKETRDKLGNIGDN